MTLFCVFCNNIHTFFRNRSSSPCITSSINMVTINGFELRCSARTNSSTLKCDSNYLDKCNITPMYLLLPDIILTGVTRLLIIERTSACQSPRKSIGQSIKRIWSHAYVQESKNCYMRHCLGCLTSNSSFAFSNSLVIPKCR